MLYTQPRRNFTESIIKGRNVVVNKEAMNETMNETMKYVSEMQEKTKKIEKMSSIQRKRHQRQFATLHFLMYGIKKFLGDSFFEDSTKKRVITIVYEPKTKGALDNITRESVESHLVQNGNTLEAKKLNIRI